tara:strand:- start:157 stop:600 length:444 start_codon:yes stop_codon:yes gene_type:complete
MEIEPEVLDCMDDLIKKVVKKEYNRQYRLKNKEKNKEYRLKNKEKINESNRQYRLNNKEKIKEYNQTESRIKSNRISSWKRIGVITDDWNELYDHYLKTTLCNECNVVLTYDKKTTATTKCLDHDHSITDAPNFRNILCNLCNVRRR